MIKWPGLDSQVSMAAVSACLIGGCPSKMSENWLIFEIRDRANPLCMVCPYYFCMILESVPFTTDIPSIAILWVWMCSLFKMLRKCFPYVHVFNCLHLTLCTLPVNLSVSVVLEWRHAQLSLMALCSTCRLTGQGSTAPEADSHKQKLCVYWHQATTSLSPAGGHTKTQNNMIEWLQQDNMK